MDLQQDEKVKKKVAPCTQTSAVEDGCLPGTSGTQPHPQQYQDGAGVAHQTFWTSNRRSPSDPSFGGKSLDEVVGEEDYSAGQLNKSDPCQHIQELPGDSTNTKT